jgi:hypothetical protein
MTQQTEPPAIRIVPYVTAEQPKQEETASTNEYVAPVEVKEDKLIGNMNTEEFTEILILAIIKSDSVRETLKESHEYEPDEVNDTPTGKLLGTIGDVAHGTLDIIEGVARGAVDIVTFGKARRK